MKNDPKDNKTTNSQYNDSAIGYKPNPNGDKKYPQQPATDADDNGTKAEKEIGDTDHEHSYITPTDDQTVATEKTQNSNPGNVANNNQGANQLI
jgi:hypothetical protein